MSEEVLQQVMGIIAQAGAGKSLALEALASARERAYDEAAAKLSESGEAIQRAHAIHLRLLAQSAGFDELPVTFLLMHASDYLSSALLAYDLVEELVLMYRELRGEADV